MQIRSFFTRHIPRTILFLSISFQIQAQPITGIWKGKMGNSRVELKLVRKGDSLIGTSYYYDSKTNYCRYSVRGYFDDRNNDVIWWDDSLLAVNGARHFIGTGSHADALLAVADFNCPGEGIMKLDGHSSHKDDQHGKKELHLVKGNNFPVFPDEWDFLIDNYAYGVSHPEIVDSIEQMAYTPVYPSSPSETPDNQPSEPIADSRSIPHSNTTGTEKTATNRSSRPVAPIEEMVVPEKKEPVPPTFIPPSQQTNEERFASRTKILQNVIPLKGDSIELRFYDNAEIDGDSIAVFLNGHLLKEHILLAEEAYIMKLAVTDLQADNELVMVAENLGTIPPNTSLMVALVEDKRYEAHLQSTMGSSALVRLVKP